jgi:hypothetical protein
MLIELGGVDRKQARELLRRSDGSVERALKLLETDRARALD